MRFTGMRVRSIRTKLLALVVGVSLVVGGVSTLYDVINLLTSIANEDVTYRTKESLQFLGGAMASKPEAFSHRCSSCQQTVNLSSPSNRTSSTS